MFFKMHHASVDGMAGMHLLSQMHGMSPRKKKGHAEPGVVLGDRDPSVLELATRAVMNNTNRAMDLSRFSAQMVGKLSNVAVNFASRRWSPKLISGDEESGKRSEKTAPRTRFSNKLSGHRVVEAVGLPMAAIKQLRGRVDGVTINDVFLALAGGSLRKYLEAKRELPKQSLTTMMPISLRTDASAGGNDVGFAVVQIRTDLADPLARLRACHAASQAAKQNNDVLAGNLTKTLTEVLPSFVTDLVARHMITPSLNTIVSNVRGPEQPLYIAGAQLQRFYPISIPGDHVGINHTAVSYAGYMWLGVVACRDMLPDPEFYAQCMRDSFNEMLMAAGIPPVTEAAFTNAPIPRDES